jgi:2Fe-2S ferredoxin
MTGRPDEDGEHRVLVRPAGIELWVSHGESLMAAANRQGWYWPTSCGGSAVCNRCCVVVPPAFETSFLPMTKLERDGLRAVRWLRGDAPGERLACQAGVVGDAEVVKRFVRPLADGDTRLVEPSTEALADRRT